jgi:hypothetical protein
MIVRKPRIRKGWHVWFKPSTTGHAQVIEVFKVQSRWRARIRFHDPTRGRLMETFRDCSQLQRVAYQERIQGDRSRAVFRCACKWQTLSQCLNKVPYRRMTCHECFIWCDGVSHRVRMTARKG